MAAVLMAAFNYVGLSKEHSETMERITTLVTDTFPEVSSEMVVDGGAAVAAAVPAS